MPFQVADVTAKPVLTYQVGDPERGPQRLVSIHTGEVLLVDGHGQVRISVQSAAGATDRGEPVSLFIPDAPVLAPGAVEPLVVAEAYLCGSIMERMGGKRDLAFGVAEAHARYAPDPRGGNGRWLLLGFLCSGWRAVRVGYRVTVLRDLG